MDKQKLEEARQLAMSMTSHPVAFGTIERTERAGGLLGELVKAHGDLAREAHTWWTACRDATGEIERLREVAARMVAGIDHLDKLAREWEPDHSSGADRRGWLLAKDARDDAARLLGPNVGGEARLAAHQPSQTTTATPQGVASTDQLGRASEARN